MRYAIVSDLHANLQAWKAIHLDLRSNGADQIICLGDLVGYGPNPVEVLQAVHKDVDAFALGNHDAVACGKLDDALFNDRARACIAWTRAQLGPAAIRFLSSLPLTLTAPGFRCAHGEFSAPGRFDYVLEADAALPSWKAVAEPLLFVGHTHDPALFLLGPSGIPRTVEVQDFVLEPGKRYFVNVGSAGQPRDGDPRASYCIYDTDQQAVFWRRVPFDLDAYREAVARAGIDIEASYFLHHDPRLGRPPLREMLNFSPPSSPEQAARNTVAVQDIADLKRRVTRWRMTSLALMLGALLATGTGGVLAWRHHTRSLVIEPSGWTERTGLATGEATHNLLSLPDTPVGSGSSIPGWRVQLGNRYRQRAGVVLVDTNAPALSLESGTMRDEICLSAAPVNVQPGVQVYPEALFLKAPGFAGHIALVVSLQRKPGQTTETISHYHVKEPNQSLPGGWMRAKQKFEVPAHGTQVQFHIRGTFTGRVLVKGLSLTTSTPAGARETATAAPQTPAIP